MEVGVGRYRGHTRIAETPSGWRARLRRFGRRRPRPRSPAAAAGCLLGLLGLLAGAGLLGGAIELSAPEAGHLVAAALVGAVVALGSTQAVASAVAGLLLLVLRPFRLGDRIRVAGHEGVVVARSLLVTRLRTLQNEEITTPNALVLADALINYSTAARGAGLVLEVAVAVAYEVPCRSMERLLIDAARATRGVLTTPAPVVWQAALEPTCVRHVLRVHILAVADMAVIRAQLNREVLERLVEAQVEPRADPALPAGGPGAAASSSVPRDQVLRLFRREVLVTAGAAAQTLCDPRTPALPASQLR